MELYKHNKKAYEQVQKHLEKSNRTCVIHPTGTGKSFISLKFIDDNKGKNILLMAPTNVILDQFNSNIAEHILGLDVSRLVQSEINEIVAKRFPNITFSTYASVDKQTGEYDCIIFDEFHRIGAKEWGKGVKKLLDRNPESKVLGVTATPVRYLDKKRDMSKEIFNGDIASQMTLPEAIVKGILPVPTYISALYSFEEDIEQIQKQIDEYGDKDKAKEYQKLLDTAKKELSMSDGLDDIFSKNIKNKQGRFIVFCKDIDHMREMADRCLEWFKKVNPNIDFYSVHSENETAINQHSIDCFENNERNSIKLLFAIEMLNEGLHVKNIDGVIMFRPTISPTIYLQQLGRALSVGHNENPLIFDIVNNALSLDIVVKLQEEIEELVDDIIEGRSQGQSYSDYPSDDTLYKIRDRFKIIAERKEIMDVLENLKVDTKFTWDSWYHLAEEYYKEHGDLEVPNRYITKDGLPLGHWILRQRSLKKGRAAGTLTEEQEEKLLKIGMRFENKDLHEEWNKKFNYLLKFKEEYKTADVPQKYVTEDGFTLGKWCQRQRENYHGTGRRSLTDYEIEKLESVGFRFEYKDPETIWLERYKEAEKFYKKHGNLKMIRDYVTKDGFELGKWVFKQKAKYKGQEARGDLTIEQIKLLEDLGIEWFNDKIDEKLQKDEITDANKVKKKKEIANRFKSIIARMEGDSLPSKEELNDAFIDQLNRKRSR